MRDNSNVLAHFSFRVFTVMGPCATEVQRLSFVGPSRGICCPHPLQNIQNLSPVPLYAVQNPHLKRRVKRLGQSSLLSPAKI